MQNYSFVINESPYCVWNENVKKLNENFVQGIDCEYYKFIAETNLSIINDKKSTVEERLYASLTLRNYYSLALEALFSLICATLQAPGCIPGWLLKYTNSELDSLVRKINSRQSIKTRFKKINDNINWESIIGLIFEFVSDETDKDLKLEIEKNFTYSLENFADDFLNKNFKNEYNSIKHGFRIKAGGFKLAFKQVGKEGNSIEGKDWHTVLDSDYGTSFYVSEKIKNNSENVRIKTFSRNWNPENFFHALYLISYFIFNIKTFLGILLKIDLKEKLYRFPKSENYKLPWENLIGLGEIGGIEFSVDFSKIKLPTKKDILSIYNP